jgi:hypothetical protein
MPHTKRVFDALEEMIPLIRENSDNPKSLLYVGWRHDCKPWWYDTFCKELRIERVGVLEIFPKNISELEQQVWVGRYNLNPVLGDVRSIDQFIGHNTYDVIFWDHGPEHVSWDDLQKCTPLICQVAGRLVMYCCPEGEWPQGAEDGNEHEVHRNAVSKDMFEKLGFLTKSFGRPGQQGEGELLGLRFVKGYGPKNG